MHAVILAGGKGTRLRPLTVYTPKPAVPIVNRAFLLYQVEMLRRAGIDEITLSLSYQPDKIEQILGDGAELGVNLRFITEPSPLGTGGAYRFAADGIDDTTVVLNGDILTDLDLAALIEAHRTRGAAATLALKPVEDPSRYGLVVTREDGTIENFLEKPTRESISDLPSNTINAGIYVLEPSIMDLVPLGENRSFEYDVFPVILERGLPFYGYTMDHEYWRDIGVPESYLNANLDMLSGRLKGFAAQPNGDADIATAAAIDSRSRVAAGVVVKPGARILNSVLGPGVQIGEKTVIEDSVIWAHTRVASGAEVSGAVIGRSCHIGRNATIRPGSVLGDKSQLTDYTKV